MQSFSTEKEFSKYVIKRCFEFGWIPLVQQGNNFNFKTTFMTGTPDLIVLLNNGVTYFFELKLLEKYRLSDAQLKFAKKIRALNHNFEVLTPYNVNLMLKKINEFHR